MILTSDAASILRELDVVHPAAKLIVMASQQQEAEMGDATNMVIVLCGEMLKKAEELLRMGLKTSDVVQGFERAQKEALRCLDRMCTSRQSLVRRSITHYTKFPGRTRCRLSKRPPLPPRTRKSHPHRNRLETIRLRRLPRRHGRRGRSRSSTQAACQF